MLFNRYHVIVLVFAVCIGYIILLFSASGHDRDPRNPLRCSPIQVVDIESLEHEQDVIKNAIDKGLPVVLRNSMAARDWKAMKKWNSEEFMTQNCQMDGIKVGKQPVFVYYEEEFPLAQISPRDKKYAFKTVTMDSKRFFKKILSRDNEWLYYTKNIDQFCGATFVNDIEPYFDNYLVGENDFERNIWIGGKGVIASSHYDAYHNFYMQIQGEKLFIISPPSTFKAQYPFPRLHPSDRQSQIIWEDYEKYESLLEKFPEFDTIQYSFHKLNPGDLLYLPPFWFHRVESLSEISISANIWSARHEMDKFKSLLDDAFPFLLEFPDEFQQSTPHILFGVVSYFQHLFKLSFDHNASLIQEMHDILFNHMYRNIAPIDVNRMDFECPHMYISVAEATQISNIATNCAEQVYARVFSHVNSMHIRTILLLNLLESGTSAFFTDPIFTIHFIYKCIKFE